MNLNSKFIGAVFLASAVITLPVAAKGGKGNGGGGGGGNQKSQTDHGTSHKADKSKPQGNANKADKAHKAEAKEMKRAGIDHNHAKGLAKQHQFGGYKPLPPGIRKNLLRGKPLPPGQAHTRLPDGYLSALPAYPGYEWRGYGSDLVLVESATALIADVIMDALL